MTIVLYCEATQRPQQPEIYCKAHLIFAIFAR